MKTIIIEDEKPAARLLQRKLEKLGIQAETMLHSVKEAAIWFQENEQPDLIFLDIQLSDGLSFEIFEAVNIKSPIIFTTAYDEYALRAFKLNSIDYLLKPIDEEDLEVAIKKYKDRFGKEDSPKIDMQAIRQLFSSSMAQEYKKRLSVKIGEHIKVIPIEEVEVFYSEFKGTFLHTTDGRNYLLDQPLEVLQNDLSPKDFFRVSRKFIVALHAIKDIVVYSNSRLQITLKSYNKEEVIVSRERVGDFKEWLG
jgi:two-component system, LytTR family, response regulator LytT